MEEGKLMSAFFFLNLLYYVTIYFYEPGDILAAQLCLNSVGIGCLTPGDIFDSTSLHYLFLHAQIQCLKNVKEGRFSRNNQRQYFIKSIKHS